MFYGFCIESLTEKDKIDMLMRWSDCFDQGVVTVALCPGVKWVAWVSVLFAHSDGMSRRIANNLLVFEKDISWLSTLFVNRVGKWRQRCKFFAGPH